MNGLQLFWFKCYLCHLAGHIQHQTDHFVPSLYKRERGRRRKLSAFHGKTVIKVVRVCDYIPRTSEAAHLVLQVWSLLGVGTCITEFNHLEKE